MIDLRNILQGVKDHGNGQYSAFCPVCEPDKSSGDKHLYFKFENDKWLIDCKKGCAKDSILAVLDIGVKDLFADSEPVIQRQKSREHIYTNESGNILGKKIIESLSDGSKKCVWYRYTQSGYVIGLNNFKMPLYHLDKLINSTSDTVYITEGEKDVETMEGLGFTATTTPNGGSQAKIPDDNIKYLSGKNVIIIRDNDTPGIEFAEKIQKLLLQQCSSVIVIDPLKIYPELKKKGDISDIVQVIGDNETLKRLPEAIEACKVVQNGSVNDDLYQRKYILEDKNGNYKVKYPYLAEYIKANEKYFLVKESERNEESFHLYRNGVYNFVTVNEVKGLIKSMLPLPLQTAKGLDEVYKLLITNNDNFTSIDNFNTDENIINFKNGLLYLDTMEVKPHSPDILSTIQIDCDYNPNAKPPEDSHFDKFMDYFTNGDIHKRRFLLQYMGVAVSNIAGYKMKKALFMVGEGNSGKTQLKGLCVRLIGRKYISTADLETLEERFGLSNVYNRRIVGSNDMSFVSARELKSFKMLTGGDEVSVEFKNKGSFSYVFKGVLWLCGNELPKFGGDKGNHVYDRIIPLRCDHVVPEHMRDPKLLDKLYSEREYIIKLCVDGLKQVIANGCKYNLPDDSVNDLSKYKIDNDSVLQFYHECCAPRREGKINDSITQYKIYQVYKQWCMNNNNGFAEKKQIFIKTLDDYGVGATRIQDGYTFYKDFTLSDVAYSIYHDMI